jgi:hypothetical protein
MLIIFQDEYEETIHTVEDLMVPRVGDTLNIGSTDVWHVTKVTWEATYSNSQKFTKALVSVKPEDEIRAPVKESMVDHTGRLNKMDNAIINATKRLDELEKKNKQLREEVVTVRQHIKRNTPKKDPNVTN